MAPGAGMAAFSEEDAAFERSGDSDVYLRAWADTNPLALAILGLDLVLVWENDAARAIFEDGRHLVRSGGKVACADKGQAASLQTFLSGLGDGSGVWACRSQDGSHLLVRADVLGLPGIEPAVVLTLCSAEARRPSLWADLTQVFGLTAAEAAIAKRLVGGDRAEIVARDLGVSLETVRTHIRRIYNKLSIGSREELFSVINPFRAVLF